MTLCIYWSVPACILRLNIGLRPKLLQDTTQRMQFNHGSMELMRHFHSLSTDLRWQHTQMHLRCAAHSVWCMHIGVHIADHLAHVLYSQPSFFTVGVPNTLAQHMSELEMAVSGVTKAKFTRPASTSCIFALVLYRQAQTRSRHIDFVDQVQKNDFPMTCST